MRYTQLTKENVQAMLAAIGVKTLGDLFLDVPADSRLNRQLALPIAMSEPQLRRHMESLAARNHGCDELVCFMGGGAYDHFIPTVVDHLISQGSFLTAYTPYQAEASQGSLQAFYEFQTMVCQLTGMDVANASLYELGSAAAEAVLMARGSTAKRHVLVAETVHPHVKQVIQTYCGNLPLELREVPSKDGRVDLSRLPAELNTHTAAFLVQSPNFYGQIEPLDQIAPLCKKVETTLVVSVDPISCGLLKTPGDLGADVVIADGQPLGIPLQFGGPWCGLMAVREPFMRRLPGRIIGRTVDRASRTAYCLTLQTREQHIRGAKATSNICTNQGLLALRVTMYLAAMGRQGIAQAARQCFDKAHYAAKAICGVRGYSMRYSGPFFKEFVVNCPKPAERVIDVCRQEGLLAGVPLTQFGLDAENALMIAVTEKRTREEMDRLVDILKRA